VKTKLVYDKWAHDIGLEIVSGAENLAKIGTSK
jgi:hypothetical protein